MRTRTWCWVTPQHTEIPRPRLCLLLELGPQPGCRAKLKVTGKFSAIPWKEQGYNRAFTEIQTICTRKRNTKIAAVCSLGKVSRQDWKWGGDQQSAWERVGCRQHALLQAPGLQPARVLPLRLEICIQAPRTAAGARGFFPAVPAPGCGLLRTNAPASTAPAGGPLPFGSAAIIIWHGRKSLCVHGAVEATQG